MLTPRRSVRGTGLVQGHEGPPRWPIDLAQRELQDHLRLCVVRICCCGQYPDNRGSSKMAVTMKRACVAGAASRSRTVRVCAAKQGGCLRWASSTLRQFRCWAFTEQLKQPLRCCSYSPSRSERQCDFSCACACQQMPPSCSRLLLELPLLCCSPWRPQTLA